MSTLVRSRSTIFLPLAAFGPAVMRTETGGRYLWFTALIGGGLGRIDEQTGEVKVLTWPTPLSIPVEDTIDGQGNVCESKFDLLRLCRC